MELRSSSRRMNSPAGDTSSGSAPRALRVRRDPEALGRHQRSSRAGPRPTASAAASSRPLPPGRRAWEEDWVFDSEGDLLVNEVAPRSGSRLDHEAARRELQAASPDPRIYAMNLMDEIMRERSNSRHYRQTVRMQQFDAFQRDLLALAEPRPTASAAASSRPLRPGRRAWEEDWVPDSEGNLMENGVAPRSGSRLHREAARRELQAASPDPRVHAMNRFGDVMREQCNLLDHYDETVLPQELDAIIRDAYMHEFR